MRTKSKTSEKVPRRDLLDTAIQSRIANIVRAIDLLEDAKTIEVKIRALGASGWSSYTLRSIHAPYIKEDAEMMLNMYISDLLGEQDAIRKNS